MCNQIYLRFHICPCELRYCLDECEYGRLDPRCKNVSMSIKWTHRDYCHYHMSVRAAARAKAKARAQKHGYSGSSRKYFPPPYQHQHQHRCDEPEEEEGEHGALHPHIPSECQKALEAAAKNFAKWAATPEGTAAIGRSKAPVSNDPDDPYGHKRALTRPFNPLETDRPIFTGLPWTPAGMHFQPKKPSSWWWRDYKDKDGKSTILARPLLTAAAADPERFAK
ncbi:hypothetical protein F4775DRAFT_599762 [Biscogniauxia sp. FL1348]|nr:hypothetical protein F4775DRAFT_599762 [Biscogniauxia sp. FL1348]